MGKLAEDELVGILNKYGTLSNNGEETILDKTLTSSDKKHEIKVREIWDVPFEKKTEIAKCVIEGHGGNEVEMFFVVGTIWDENSSLMNRQEYNGVS